MRHIKLALRSSRERKSYETAMGNRPMTKIHKLHDANQINIHSSDRCKLELKADGAPLLPAYCQKCKSLGEKCANGLKSTKIKPPSPMRMQYTQKRILSALEKAEQMLDLCVRKYALATGQPELGEIGRVWEDYKALKEIEETFHEKTGGNHE